jgi:hypothetical protein
MGTHIFGAIALLAVMSSAAFAAPVDAGLVEEVSGTATAAGAAGKRALAARDDVYIGDDVATAALSRARLALGKDTVVRLGENADLRIDKYLLEAGGVLTVGAGAVLLDKTPSNGPTKLRGAFGLITVRGTRVFAGPSKGVIGVFVAHGVVDLTSGGVTVTLHDGEGSDAAESLGRPSRRGGARQRRVKWAGASRAAPRWPARWRCSPSSPRWLPTPATPSACCAPARSTGCSRWPRPRWRAPASSSSTSTPPRWRARGAGPGRARALPG